MPPDPGVAWKRHFNVTALPAALGCSAYMNVSSEPTMMDPSEAIKGVAWT